MEILILKYAINVQNNTSEISESELLKKFTNMSQAENVFVEVI
jgi:hypothetical protein